MDTVQFKIDHGLYQRNKKDKPDPPKKVTGHAEVRITLYEHAENDNEEAIRVGDRMTAFVEYTGKWWDFEAKLLDAIYSTDEDN